MGYLDMHYLNFQIFGDFPSFCLLWSLTLFQSFKIYLDLFFGLAYDLSWRMLHVHFKRMCILLSLSVLCYFSIQLFCHLSKAGYWNLYNYRIVCFFFQFCPFFLHIFGDSRYIYTLVISSGCIDIFIIMKYLFVSSLFLVLKSVCLTLI